MAHTFDGTANAVATTSSPVTISFTPGAGASLMVVGIGINSQTARAGGAPTFNGIAMTQAGTTQLSGTIGGGATSVELWYITNLPIGAFNVSVPNTGTLQLSVIVSTFKSATGMSALELAPSQAANTGVGSTNPSVSVTTAYQPGGDVIVDIVTNSGGGVLTASQNLLVESTSGANKVGAQYALQATTGTVAMSWTAGSQRWAQIGAAFQEVNHNAMMMTGCLT